MSALSRRPKGCQKIEIWLSAYVDLELDAVHCHEVEQHIDDCSCCRQELTLMRATRNGLRQFKKAHAPQALRQRISACMVAERKRERQEASLLPAIGVGEGQPEHSQSESAKTTNDQGKLYSLGWLKQQNAAQLLQLRFVVPMAAVATLLLVIGALDGNNDAAPAPTVVAKASNVVSTFDHFLEDIVAAHAQPPPPEVTTFDKVGRFDPYVGVRIPQPQLANVGAKFKGARIQSRAAMLQYLLRKRHRVSVYVFDPARVPLKANRLRPRRYGSRHVYVGQVRGYAVAASEQNGVGWALASDLSNDESAQLLLVAAKHDGNDSRSKAKAHPHGL